MLLTAGQSLVAKIEPQELFETLTRDTYQVMRARACALYLYDAALETVRLAFFAGAGTAPAQGEHPLDSCLVGSAIRTRKPVAFVDIRSPEYLDVVDLPRDEVFRSVLAAPLTYEGVVLGVLAVFTDRVHRFDNDEKRLCSALASLGAVALQNARLYARVFKSEESLRKNEQLTTLGLLAAEIAHEIRNPLTVLKLLLGGLGLEFPEGDPRRTDMRVIGEKLDQLEEIVTRVLNFGKAPTSLHSRCSLAEIVEDTLILVRLKFAQNKIRVDFRPPSAPLVIEGNPGQLQQVLLNVLFNSMHAMPEGGAIALTLGSENHGPAPLAMVDVADSGAGISESIRDRIFDSFLSGRPNGTGLGLAIAKRIMQSHHGDIELLKTSPEGTTVRLTLPLTKG
jgi:signal transduction histidine kinase